jgi:hypothetical protein
VSSACPIREWQQAYWRAISDAVNGPLLPANLNPLLNGHYAALTNNGVYVTSPDVAGTNCTGASPLRVWVQQRRNYLTNQLASVAPPFAITNNNGNSFAVTNQTSVTLAGKAPVEVANIRINGSAINANVTWTSVTNWSLGFPLATHPSTNTGTLQGYDRLNQLLATNLYQKSITITNK